MSPTVDDLKLAAQSLGDCFSEDGVADCFKQRDIKGQRISLLNCPVARYLTQEIGAPVYVNGSTARLQKSPFHGSFNPQVFLPPMVTRFTVLFDVGHYPDLEET
jgi:hypothetical protein